MEVLVLANAIILTQEQLEERLVYWQKVLRLQDWDIRIRLCRRWELPGEHLDGNCRYHLDSKTAQISILCSDDYEPGWRPYDAERILLHELIHLHLIPLNISNDAPEAVAEEQAVNLLACAFVKLDRGNAAPLEVR